MIHKDKNHVFARSCPNPAYSAASTLFLCISITTATSCFSLCTSKRRIWNHLNQKQSQFPQCIIGIPAWPFAPCCVASLSGGAQHKVGTQQHKYAAHCAFPPGTLKKGETEWEGGGKEAEQALSFFALASRIKTFSPPQIRTFLLLWMLCLLAESGGKRNMRKESTPLWWVLVQKGTEGDDNGWCYSLGGKLHLQHYKAFKHIFKEILKLC